MADINSDRDGLTHSLSSASDEVSDARNDCLESQGNQTGSRCNPFNTFKLQSSSPTMEKELQAFTDGVHVPGRSRRHCHKPLDTSTNAVARRQLLSVTILCLLFMAIETAGGILANSLALFTDVLHLGSDLINFLVCLLAQWLATKAVTQKMTFGYHRAEILGAFFSVIFIWVVSGVLCYVAADRIAHGHYMQVKPDEMLVTAAVGLLFNIIMGVALHSDACFGGTHSHGTFGHTHTDGTEDDELSQEKARIASFDAENGSPQKYDKENDNATQNKQLTIRPGNINVRAAFIHVVGDTIQSLGVLISALVIKFAPNKAYRLADPICTFMFSLVVLITTLAILRDVVTVFMEGVPRGISFVSLKKDLAALDGVVAVHSLQIWALTLEKTAVAVHLVIEHLHLHDEVLTSATRLIQDKHHAHFTTIQVELYDQVMNNCEECLRFNS